MTEQHSRLYLPPRTNKRTYTERLTGHLKSNQLPQTPTALFNTLKAPRSLDHIHDFRQSLALPSNTNDNKNRGTSIPYLKLEKNTQQPSTTSPSSTTSLHTSIFICFICHTWVCISSSTRRHTCTAADYVTHHYHVKESWTRSEEYQCCGCGDHIEISYHDAILSTALLSDLSSTRALTRSPLTSTEQATAKPTMLSTVETCQRYIRDLLNNTRRDINSENLNFRQRVGLDDATLRLMGLIGFSYRDGFLKAPGDIDNNRLCMIHEELAVYLASLTCTKEQSVEMAETDYPLADSMILDDFFGRRDDTENVPFINDSGLVDLCGDLGVTSSATDELILWAYRKMTLERPDELQKLLQTLENIAAIKGGDLLQKCMAVDRSTENAIISKEVADKAYQYFGAQNDIDDETIIAAHRYKKQDFPRGKSIHDEKLRVIGDSRKSEMILQYLESESADLGGQYRNSYHQMGRARNSPVGLTNIGNTCYLNSILQYYYTLIPFRNTIINMNDYVEDEDNDDWRDKHLGGILIDRKEVKRAKKFMDLLQNIFIQLEHTSDYAITPELELAKMTLLNAKNESMIDNSGSNSDGAKTGVPSKENFAAVRDKSKMDSDNVGNSSFSTAIEKQSSSYSGISTSDQASGNSDMAVTDAYDTKKAQANRIDQRSPHVDSTSAKQTDDMNTMMLGKQQDVTECMDNVMYLVEAALKSNHTEETTQAKNLIRDLFYGKSRQILSYKDNNTFKDVQKVKEEDFSHVIVDATSGRTLYDGLDEHYFAEKVENFQGGQEATREVTVQRFPPILQIQIQRAQFDRSTCQVYKSNAFIQFDKTIYLDRYLDSTFHALAPRREKVATLRSHLAQCQQDIKNQSIKVDSIASETVKLPVPWVLEKAISVLDGSESKCPGPNPVDLMDVIDQLKKEAVSAEATMKASINQMNMYETKIKDEYSDLTDCAYQLHAVFMHKGEANYGHYWLYILDQKTDCWWKFNDSLVTKVKENEIFKDTSGTQSNPYLLVYIKNELVDSLAAVSRTDA
ncbi:hypothetical protein BCR42DRAFT_451680 [Absidia repens]|uniref:ubiquitinyl hydrolase 1 n=1 Tax=Absidia repens TaxID=90262 RepID=A0A1X2IG22_9FUNG|nr:hypothetical protein BCR42DRAFT_451680 [Absidia repens]